MAEKVSKRHFRAYLKDFLLRMEHGEIFEINGLEIGVVGPRVHELAPPSPKRMEDVLSSGEQTVWEGAPLFSPDKIKKNEAFQNLRASLDIRATLDRSTHDTTVEVRHLQDGDFKDGFVISGERGCDSCKKPGDLYEHWEEGQSHAICAICALRAKLPVHKMKRL